MPTNKAKIYTTLGGILFSLVTTLTVAATTSPTPSQQVQRLLTKHFGIATHNDAEAKTIMTKQLIHCYEKISHCTPGHYKYAIPDPIASLAAMSSKTPSRFTPLILGTYTIQGYQGDKCIIDDSYTMQGTTYFKKCQFNRDTLSIFTEKEAITSAQGSLPYDADHLSPLQKAVQDNCQASLNTARSS